MAVRKASRVRARPRSSRKAATSSREEWRLANRGPIRAYDEYSDSEIRLTVGQKNPSNVEGLLIDFRYTSRDREVSRRSVLCWQCGRDMDRIYVRGYCAFREELRTFRIDRMSDVVAFVGEQQVQIDDVYSFFAGFAAHAPEGSDIRLLEATEV